VSTLSDGEQKQLEIARGLLLNPKPMLIDESSMGLSPSGSLTIPASASFSRAEG